MSNEKVIDCCKSCAELAKRVEALEKLFETDTPAPKKEKWIDRPRDLLMVVEYFKELNIKDATINAEKFFNFYEAKGWMVGKNKVKKWRSCVKTWDLPRENAIQIKNSPQSKFVM